MKRWGVSGRQELSIAVEIFKYCWLSGVDWVEFSSSKAPSTPSTQSSQQHLQISMTVLLKIMKSRMTTYVYLTTTFGVWQLARGFNIPTIRYCRDLLKHSTKTVPCGYKGLWISGHKSWQTARPTHSLYVPMLHNVYHVCMQESLCLGCPSPPSQYSTWLIGPFILNQSTSFGLISNVHWGWSAWVKY